MCKSRTSWNSNTGLERLCILVVTSIWFVLAPGLLSAQTPFFDFDTGSPSLALRQNIPFDQTSAGVTAHFSSPQGNVFSIQTDASTSFHLSQFSAQYLYPNTGNRDVLDISFNHLVTNISFVFATADFPPIEIPTPILVTAYTNSTATPLVGSVTARGTYGTDTLPMGSAALNLPTPFNVVEVQIQPGGGTGFLLDNLTVSLAPAPAPPVLQSSASINGFFVDDLTAAVDPIAKTITAPQGPGVRFLRLRADTPSLILSIRPSGADIVLQYDWR
jgi:hypothetical protein